MAFIELPTADLTASTFKSKANKWVETPGLVDLQVNGFAGVDLNSPGLTYAKERTTVSYIIPGFEAK